MSDKVRDFGDKPEAQTLEELMNSMTTTEATTSFNQPKRARVNFENEDGDQDLIDAMSNTAITREDNSVGTQIVAPETRNRWGRPPRDYINPDIDSTFFQQIDIDSYVGSVRPGMPGPDKGVVPIIRMFGVTEAGVSVMSHIHGFTSPAIPSKNSSSSLEHNHSIETDIDFVIGFMADTHVVGCNWIELPAGAYTVRLPEEMESRCQLEVDIAYNKFKSYKPEGEWSKVAPLRTLSFDIECPGPNFSFLTPKCSVIQIANHVRRAEEESIKVIFCLKDCSPIEGHEVICFDDEKQLLKEWSDFVRQTDPDLLTGYNIQNFDLWYLLERAKQLELHSFPFLGRIKKSQTRVSPQTIWWQQKGNPYNKRENKVINIEGRVQFDLYFTIFRNYYLKKNYKLGTVSKHFLENQLKGDVTVEQMEVLQTNGNAEDRRKIAVYCFQDALLPLKLIDKLKFVINYMNIARVTGVPLKYLLAKGRPLDELTANSVDHQRLQSLGPQLFDSNSCLILMVYFSGDSNPHSIDSLQQIIQNKSCLQKYILAKRILIEGFDKVVKDSKQ